MEVDSTSVPLDDLLVHAAWVRALATSLLCEPDAADDVVQETWLAALRTPPRERANLRGWLARVVRNAVSERGRKGARQSDREAYAAGESENAPSPQELAERVETQRNLAAHVLALEEPFRQTVLLRYYEELSSAEISRRTNVPAGTVRWRLKRGLDELRERLDDGYGGRRAWCLALAPLVRRAALLESTAATGAAAGLPALLQGILAMNLGLKIVLVTGVVLAAAFLTPLGTLAVNLVSSSQRAELEPVAVTYQPIETEAATAEVAGEKTDQRRPAENPEVAEQAPRAFVLASVFDPTGEPVAGASMRIGGYPSASTSSNEDGQGLVPLPDDWDFERGYMARLVVDVPGFLLAESTFTPVAGDTLELGVIQLEHSGAIEGIVVDAAGQPVQGAWVEVDEAPLGRERLEEKRLDKSAAPSGDVQTDAAGRFLLERVPVGERVVWASREGQLAAHSGLVEVRTKLKSSGVVLELGVLGPEDFMRGVVLDPEGLPLPRARLELSFKTTFRKGSRSFQADEHGRFIAAWAPRAAFKMRAADPQGRYAAAVREDVRGGPEEIVLRLTEPEWMTVEVRGPDGPIAGPTVVVWNEARNRPLVDTTTVEVEGSKARFVVPAEPFVVQAEADGHDAATIGPLPGLSAPREISIDLTAVPGVRGRVLAGDGGAGIAGAEVTLYREAPHYHSVNDFPVRVDPSPAAEARTDTEGWFHLTLRESGSFFLRAEVGGSAPDELGPLAIDRAAGLSGLELRLGQGGAIAGRVLARAGERVAGTIVAVSRGDGHARTQRVGTDGTYRFEQLIPGSWLVTRRTDEISPDHRSSSSNGLRAFDETLIDANCTVVGGETTRFDLDLGGEQAEVLLAGNLLLDGSAPEGWNVLLIDLAAGGMVVRRADDEPGRIGPDGSFELGADSPGSYRLTLQAPGGEEGRAPIFSAELELFAGTNTWSRAFATGSVRVENPRDLHAAGIPLDFLLTQADGVDVLVPIVPDAARGEALLAPVPAGPARIVRFELTELATLSDFPAGKSGLVELTVHAGETTIARLP